MCEQRKWGSVDDTSLLCCCCVAAVLLLCCCCVAAVLLLCVAGGAFCVSRCYEEFRSALEHARRLDLDPRKEPLVAEAKRLFESVKDRIEVRRVPPCVSCTTRMVAYAVHALADSRCTPPPVGGEPSLASLVVLPAPELCPCTVVGVPPLLLLNLTTWAHGRPSVVLRRALSSGTRC